MIKSAYKLFIIGFLLLSSGIAFAATVEIEVNWPEWSTENAVIFRDALGNRVTTLNGGTNYICNPTNCFNNAANTPYGPLTFTFNDVPAADYDIQILDNFGDGWDGAGAYVRVRVNGVQVVNSTGPAGGSAENIPFTVTDTQLSVTTQTCSTSSLTGTWSTGLTSTATSGSIPVSMTFAIDSATGGWVDFLNENMNSINAWSDTNVQGADSLGVTFEWDSTAGAGGEAIYSSLASDGTTGGGDGTTGDITLSFGGRTVYNAILHIDRVGGTSGTTANSSRHTITTSGVTLGRLAGPSHFETYSNNSFYRDLFATSSNTESSLDSATGTAAGSVVLSGAYSSVNLALDGGGPEGAGGDAMEYVICVPQADLSLTQVVSETNPAVGENITITLALTNGGPDDANNVAVNDLLPAGLDFVSATVPAGTTYDETTGLWNIGTVANTGSVILVITAEVTSASTITNEATITNSDRVDPDSDFTIGIATDDLSDGVADDDETSVIITPFISANISVTKSDTSTDYVPGGNSVYTITITNGGPSDVSGVVISDSLPSGVTLSAEWTCASTAGSSCSASSGGLIGDTSVNLTADILDQGVITLTIPIQYSSDPADY